MAKKKEPADQNNERVREIGSARSEVIVEALSPMQLEETKTNIVDLLRRQDEIKAGIKALAKEAKGRLDEVKLQLDRCREEVETAKRRTEIEVREYLTKRNEVIRIRTDTGEQIGARTAKPAELQESMEFDSDEEQEGFDA